MGEKKSGFGRVALTILGLGASAALLYYIVPSGAWREKVMAPSVAPDFKFPDLNGRMVSLSQYRGHAVLVDFWATWCGPCREEIPDLIALYNRYKDRGFVVLGVSMDSLGAAAVGPFVAQMHIPYPVLIAGGEDPPPGYPVFGFPTAFLIDGQGRVVARYLGPQSVDDLSPDVEAALEE